MSESDAQAGLHWLTFTHRGDVEQVLDRLGGSFSSVEAIGGYGQPRSVCHESGTRVFFGSERHDQPICVNMPGEVCETWWVEGLTWAEDLGACVTRSDFALDLEPADEARRRMMQLRRAWKTKRVETACRSFSEVRSEPPDGWTFYWGGKTSAMRFRAYDRRGPLRLEFQLRPNREVGATLAKTINHRGPAALWRSCASSIKFKVDWYEDLLKGDTVVLDRTYSEESFFLKVVEQMQLQLGVSFWALSQLGLTLDDLATPPEEIRGDVAAKLLRWADEAQDEGYDGEKLKREVKCKLKSRRNSK